jgi:hypothetical protein
MLKYPEAKSFENLFLARFTGQLPLLAEKVGVAEPQSNDG